MSFKELEKMFLDSNSYGNNFSLMLNRLEKGTGVVELNAFFRTHKTGDIRHQKTKNGKAIEIQ